MNKKLPAIVFLFILVSFNKAFAQAPSFNYPGPKSYVAGTAITPLAPVSAGGAIPGGYYGQTITLPLPYTNLNGIVMDTARNIYVSDLNINAIRKITPAGTSSIFAGSGLAGFANGTGTAASFSQPGALAIDAAGNIYVADAGNYAVRKITPYGVVTTLAGSGSAGNANGTGAAATFNSLAGIVVNSAGIVYVSDNANHNIRKITAAGVVTILAGNGTPGYANGTGTAALFNYPRGLALDASENIIVADTYNYLIRKVTPAGVVSTLAGNTDLVAGFQNGTASAARFNIPSFVTIDATGNIYVADLSNVMIRKIGAGGAVTTLAGSGVNGTHDGIAAEAEFSTMVGMACDPSGNLYVTGDALVRKVQTTGYSLSPALPVGLDFDAATGIISGIPTFASAAKNYSVTGYNLIGSSTATVSIAVTGTIAVAAPPVQAPVITYAGPKTYAAGTAIATLTPTKTGGAIPGVLYGQTSTTTLPFGTSNSMVTDAAGNVYYADYYNNLIRKTTPAGVTSVLAGSGNAGTANGNGTAASFNGPTSLAIDAAGNIYVADYNNNLIRKVSPAGTVTTFAGNGTAGRNNGAGVNASFSQPLGIAADSFGNLYVVEYGNALVRKISPQSVVSTLAGNAAGGYADGTGAAAAFSQLRGVAVDAAANVYVTDAGNQVIRKINPAGVVTTLAGTAGAAGFANGTGTAAQFNNPYGITIDAVGNLYIADVSNYRVRKITPAGVVTTLAGDGSGNFIDGVGPTASFGSMQSIAMDASGNLLLTDGGSLRKVSAVGYSISATLPVGLTFDPSSGNITGTPTFAAAAQTYTINAYNAGGSSTANISITVTGTITTPLPSVNPPAITYAGPKTYPAGTAIATLTPSNTGGIVPGVLFGQTTTFASGITVSSGIVTDAAKNIYYSDQNAHVIRKITPAGVASVVAGSGTPGAGDGVGTAASFNTPSGLAMDAAGNIYVADATNNLIRKITPAGVVSRFAGNGAAGRIDGVGTTASFNNPTGIAVDNYGNVYVTDYNNKLIRKISPSGTVTTLAGNGLSAVTDGTGSEASFYQPFNLALDASGNIYVAERDAGVIRKVTPSGVVTTFAGSPFNGGFADGTGTAAMFNGPSFIATDLIGNIYVSDTYNQRIRKITPAKVVTTIAGGNQALVDGTGAFAGFSSPQAITADAAGSLYVADNNGIRKISAVGYAISPALPAGLNFEPSTGSISGTPVLASSAKNYIISAYNIGGNSNATINITVTGTLTTPPPVVTPPAISYAGPQSYAAGTAITALTPSNTGGAVPGVTYGQTTTLSSGFGTSLSLVSDNAQNIYIADLSYHLIRKITPAGVSSVFAGSGNIGSANGTGTAASFNSPQGLVFDAAGNLYVADGHNNLIRKITPAGVVSTFAGTGAAGSNDGTAETASFNNPVGLTSDRFGNIYVADYGSNLIRKISPAGTVTTLAGGGYADYADGTGSNARFNQPYGLAIDLSGNVYVADANNYRIRKVTPAGVVTTVAGNGGWGSDNGSGSVVSFGHPEGIALDAAGNIYVTDTYNRLIRKITPAGVTSTFAGNVAAVTDGTGTAANYYNPEGISIDANGYLYIADNGNVRKLSAVGYNVSPVLPAGLIFDSTNGVISGTPAVATTAANYTISAYNAGGASTATLNITVTGTTTAPAATALPAISYAGPQTYATGAAIAPLSPTSTGGAIPAAIYGQTTTFAGSGGAGQNNGTGTAASFNLPSAVATDVYGNVYIADHDNHVIRKISASGVVTTFAGSGTGGYVDAKGTAASFYYPSGVAVDLLGNVYVADTYNHMIRKITPAGVVTTLAGSVNYAGYADGTGLAAVFSYPSNLTVDASRNVYVSDENNNVIRKITPSGVVTTLAGNAGASGADNGTGTNATFYRPNGITVDGSGNVFVSDQFNHIIRKITSAGVVTTFAGTGNADFVDGTGTAASFNSPGGISVDKAGNLYVNDIGNNSIRKITKTGVVSTLAGSQYAGSVNGTGSGASFNNPLGIGADNFGNVYVADANNNLIRKITAGGYTTDNALPAGLTLDSATGIISGTPTAALAAATYSITAYNVAGSSTATVSIAVTGSTVTPVNVSAPNISYTTPQNYTAGNAITALLPANTGGAVPAQVYGGTISYGNQPTNGGTNGMAFDAAGNLYIAASNHIRKFSPAGVVSVFAGSTNAGNLNGKGTAARFSSIFGLAFDAQGNLYVSEWDNNLIRKVSPSGVVTTLAGSGTAGAANGTGTAASFNNPAGLVVDAANNVYVADAGNNMIRKITPAGVVSTVAGSVTADYVNGTGTVARFNSPRGLVLDAAGNLYVTDMQNQLIRKITNGVVSTFAGTPGVYGLTDGTGTNATMWNPVGITTDAAGNFYVTSESDQSYRGFIRKITPAGVVNTLAGNDTEYSFGINALAYDGAGNIFTANGINGNLLKVSAVGYGISGVLPLGLTFDPTTGAISGTPIAAKASATYTITAYNKGGSSSTNINIGVSGTLVTPVPAVAAPVISFGSAKSYTAGTAIVPAVPANTGGAVPASVYAQTSVFGPAHLTGNNISDVTIDATGLAYITKGNQVLKVTAAGVVTVFAGDIFNQHGSADGLANAAKFDQPLGIALDAAGNVYVADAGNNRIRKITPAGLVTTLAGTGFSGSVNGSALSANFNYPVDVATDNYGNVYVADQNNGMIRKVSANGTVTTLAGNGAKNGIGSQITVDGTGSGASFTNITTLALDGAGNIYVTENKGTFVPYGCLRKVTPAGVVTTVAGEAAGYGSMSGVAADLAGNIYVGDIDNYLIRKISSTGVMTVLAGGLKSGSANGTGPSAEFDNPKNLSLDATGANLFLVDYNDFIRSISLTGFTIGSPLPVGLTFDGTTGTITGTPTLASAAANYSVTAYNTGGSSTTNINIKVTGAIVPPVNPVAPPVITYTTPQSYTTGVGITALAPVNTGGIVPATVYGQTSTVTTQIGGIYNIATDLQGNIYVPSNNQILKITTGGAISVLAGSPAAGNTNGTGTAATFNNPQGLIVDASGNVYVADATNNAIRKITPEGLVTTIAGDGSAGHADGLGIYASFNGPRDIKADNYGNLYVADAGNHTIRKISPTGIVTTLAGNNTAGYADGTGSAAIFYSPVNLAVDATGNVFVIDQGNNRIRKISPTGIVTTFAGSGTAEFVDGAGVAAGFSNPNGITIDKAGNLYIADQNNHSIRKVTPAGLVSTLAGNGNPASVDGVGLSANFNYPSSIASDAQGNLFITENYYANTIRKITTNGYVLTGTLPVGLSFDATSGTITGTPTVAKAAASYTVTAYNTGGSSTATINVAVTGALTPPVSPIAPPVISYASPQSYAAGVGITALTPSNTGGAVPATIYGQTSTFVPGFNYSGIYGIALDAAGNLYLPPNNQIFKITKEGTVSVFAGSGAAGAANGNGTAASFNGPENMVFDNAGNLYVATARNNAIRKITPSGDVTTFAGNGAAGRTDGPGASATFNNPEGLAIDRFGNLYVSDTQNNLIRKISPAGIVSTLAGNFAGYADGTGTEASFNGPQGIAVDAAGNVYVADNHAIRKITPAGVVSLFAGRGHLGDAGWDDGTGPDASFYYPHGLTIDAAGNLYVADQNNHAIRKITPAGVVTTLAGRGDAGSADGIGRAATFNSPISILADGTGNLYVGDYNSGVRVITATGYTISPALPAGLIFDSTTGTISGTPLTASAAKTYTLTAYNGGGSSTTTISLAVTGTAVAPAAPTLPVISYTSPQTYAVGYPITDLTPANSGGLVPPAIYGETTTFAGNGTAGRKEGLGVLASFNNPQATATDIYGNIYVADAANNVIRRITPAGLVTTFAGSGYPGNDNGTGIAASFNYPAGIAVDKNSNVYVADANNNQIRKITPAGVVTTFAGNSNTYAGYDNGTGTAASFNYPSGIVVDKSGNLYVADTYNYTIRKITAAGVVTTLAGSTGNPGSTNGTGTAALFGQLSQLAIDGSNNIYAADVNNYRIRKITSAGVVTNFAGNGTGPGFADGTGAAAGFSSDLGLTTDAGNNIFVADAGNNLIRKISPAGVVTTIAGNLSVGSTNGIGQAANFNNPQSLATDNNGNLYVSEAGSNLIRKVSVSGYTISASLPSGLVINGKTGTLTGIPKSPSAAANYSITAYNSAGAASATVNITVIYPPVVKTSAPVTAFASMGDVTPVPVVIDGGALVTDLSKTTLASATVAVTGNFVTGQDVLAFTANAATMGNIAGTYSTTTGVLSLTSAGATATLAQWQTALSAVTYSDINNVAPNTANRTVSFVVNDGIFNSLPVTKTVSLTYTPSSNANLSSLILNNGTLAPAFAPAITTYTANVSNAIASVTLKPTTASANAKVTVNGTLVTSGTASAGLPLNIGSNTLTTVVTAQDLVTVKTYTLTLTRAATQTLTFAATKTVNYGAVDFAAGATSTNSTIPITYTSSNNAVATVTSFGTVHIVGIGSATITAAQAGNVNFDAATSVNQTLTVSPALLTVTPSLQTKTYGTANPVLTFTYTGFVNGDTQAAVTTPPTLTTTAVTSSPAGAYPITATGASAANYTFNYVAGSITVNPAVLNVSANNQSRVYGTPNAAFTVNYSGLVNGDTPQSLTAQATVNTIAFTGSPVGTYALTPGGGSSPNYSFNYADGTLTVTRAALTITADSKSKSAGAANPALTATYSGFVNGDSQASMTTLAVLNTTATTTSAVGVYPITASGAVASNYTISYVAGSLTISNVGITFNTIASKVYGNTDFDAGATSSAAITYSSSNASVATIVAGKVHIVGPGTSTITADNGSATSTQTLTVTKAPLTITANAQTKTYGSANPAFTVSYSGLVNGDTQASLATQASVTSSATTASVVGTYAITASGAAAANYNITYAQGTLTVTKALLTITADNQTKITGAANPALTVTYNGFVNSDSQASLTTLPAVTTTATAASVAGSYPITASGAASANYSFSYVAGVLTVTNASFTFAAIPPKTYGTADFDAGAASGSAITYTSSNTAVATIVSGKIHIVKTGTSTITATSSGSTLTQMFTVNPAALTISAVNQSKVYGAANPALSAAYSGFVNGENQAALTTLPTLTTTAVTTSGAGAYPIDISGAASSNYSFNYVAGNLTVSKASVTITAANSTKVAGQANPAFSVTYAGFISGQSQTVLTTLPAVTTTATTASAAGSYPITASGAVAANYTFNYVAGTLTVTEAASTSAPVITSFTPIVAQAGATVTINGSNFTGSTAVAFGGVPAVSFTVVSGTKITALLGTGASGSITVTNPIGTGTVTGFTFSSAPVISYTGPQTYTVGTAIAPLAPVNTGGAVPVNSYTGVALFAGNGTAGFANGSATTASFNGGFNLATDGSGNVYVADVSNNRIRKITPGGTVSTLAGSGAAGSANGTAASATFNNPSGVAVDANGTVYVADNGSHLIRKITAGVVSTVAGSGTPGAANGAGTAASFKNPVALTLDAAGNLYVADNGNNLIRKITPAGVVTTLAGSGVAGNVNSNGAAASFNAPTSLVADRSGNIYVADQGNNMIRKITASGVVSTFAGSGVAGSAGGSGVAATFNSPTGIAIDGAGNLYVTDNGGYIVRRITSGKTVSTLAGSGVSGSANGIGIAASFGSLTGAVVSVTGYMYVFDRGVSSVRKIAINGYKITPTLPKGLVFASTTGVISGTPTTVTAAKTYTVTANNYSGASAATISIAITNPAPTVVAPIISYSTPQSFTKGTAIASLVPANLGGAVPATVYAQVTSFAGSTRGSANGTGAAASFNYPQGVAMDAAKNIYVADGANNMIRKITPAGVVSTLAGSTTFGSANGTGTAARFNNPVGVAVDASGNVFVADQGNNLIRKITPAGVVTTFAGSGVAGYADGTGTSASFYQPTGVAADASGNLFVADFGYGTIRKITSAGIVTTLAGNGSPGLVNGTGAAASFDHPYGIVVDGAGNLYVTDDGNAAIRKITPAGVVTTFAGGASGFSDGAGAAAKFWAPTGITIDALGNLFVSDYNNNAVRKITPAGIVTTIGSNFNSVISVTTDRSGTLYIADPSNNQIRKIVVTGYSVNPALPAGLNFDSATGIVTGTPTMITEPANYMFTAYNAGGSSSATVGIEVKAPVAPVAPKPIIAYETPQTFVVGVQLDTIRPVNTGGAIPANTYANVTAFAGNTTAGSNNGTGAAASFNGAYALTKDVYGNIYVADTFNQLIRKITPAGVVTTFAGNGVAGFANGTGTAASFNNPIGVAADASGNIYVADQQNNQIRKITPFGVVSTLAGNTTPGTSNGTGAAARFSGPLGVATDAAGNVYVADSQNNLIRKVTPAGVVTTLAGSGFSGAVNGTGTAASFSNPTSLVVTDAGVIFVADQQNNIIRKVTTAGVVTTFAGSGATGSTNGTGTAASFNAPYGITADPAGNIYVADYSSHLVRRITPGGAVTTLAGSGSLGVTNAVGTLASFQYPLGITFDGTAGLVVTDNGNHLIRKIAISGYKISPSLPAGMNFSATTGAISGTPTATSSQVNYTVTAYNSSGAATATIAIAVNAAPPAPVPTTIAYAGPQSYTEGTAISALLPTVTGMGFATPGEPAIGLAAGSGSAGSANGTGTAASFDVGDAGAIAAFGVSAYVADANNNLIRKVTSGGVVTTLAGNGQPGFANGTGTAASFNLPDGIAADASGNVYVSDANNNVIRKITSAGVVTTFAGSGVAGLTDGTGAAAQFDHPRGLVLDGTGNLFVMDGNGAVRKITTAGVVTTIIANAGLNNSRYIAVNYNADIIYLSGPDNYIKEVSIYGGVDVLAGNGTAGFVNGTGQAARFNNPAGIWADVLSNKLYVTDKSNHMIRLVDMNSGAVSTYAGDEVSGSVNGALPNVRFVSPLGIIKGDFHYVGTVFILDQGNNTVKQIGASGYNISPNLPTGLVLNTATGAISGTPTAVSGPVTYTVQNFGGDGFVRGTVNIAVANPANATSPNIYTVAGIGAAIGATEGPATSVAFKTPYAMARDRAGNLYVLTTGDHRLVKINAITKNVTIIAGTGTAGYSGDGGPAASAQLNLNLPAITVDGSGNVYISDDNNNRIRRIDAATNVITTVAGTGLSGYSGDGGLATAAKIYSPSGIAFDANNNLYFSDMYNGRIRRIDAVTKNISTVAGGGTVLGAVNNVLPGSVNLGFVERILFDNAGNLYIADENDFVVHKLNAATNRITTIAGSGTFGYSGDGGAATSAAFKGVMGMAIDNSGNLYLADQSTSVIRKVNAASGIISTYAGIGLAGYSGDGAAATSAQLNYLTDLQIDSAGYIYVCDYANRVIRRIGGSNTTNFAALPPQTSRTVSIAPVLGSNSAQAKNSLTDKTGGEPFVVPALSPNGDGLNDVLQIEGISAFPDNKLSVMNKDGKLIYEANNYDNVNRVFDGRSRTTGAMLPAGTYFYLLEYKTEGGMKRKTGFFILKY
jgi:gliding motility-associated-like protein